MTPLLQQHPMVLVLVLPDVLVVPYPLPLGFNDAFYLYHRVVVECDCFLAYLRPVSQRLCCWMDFSFVAPGTHDKMVCFLIFGRRGVWQPVQRQQAYLELAVAHVGGGVDPPRAVTPQGELDPLVQLGREV